MGNELYFENQKWKNTIIDFKYLVGGKKCVQKKRGHTMKIPVLEN